MGWYGGRDGGWELLGERLREVGLPFGLWLCAEEEGLVAKSI